jgi:hypothetical protein
LEDPAWSEEENHGTEAEDLAPTSPVPEEGEWNLDDLNEIPNDNYIPTSGAPSGDWGTDYDPFPDAPGPSNTF